MTTDNTMRNEKPVVLRMLEVTFGEPNETGLFLNRFSLDVREGELVMLQVDWSCRTREMVSMLQGLSMPAHGEIWFQSQDWLGEDFDRHFSMRARIGRIFEDHAWIQNLNVIENVTLARRHHCIEVSSIDEDLRKLRKRFGAPHVGRERPAFVDPSVLQVYQWIRSLLLRPKLLLLERPMQSIATSIMPALVDAINEIRREGAAVLWLTSNATDTTLAIAPPFWNYALRQGKLMQSEGAITQ